MPDSGIWYVGPFPVDVPLARLRNVQPGDRVDVADPVVRAGLLAQDIWTDQAPAPAPAERAPRAQKGE